MENKSKKEANAIRQNLNYASIRAEKENQKLEGLCILQ